MSKEYDLQTDVLETIVAGTPVTKKHAALLTTFATRTVFKGARYAMTRDEFGERPARIIDAGGREIAADYRAWVDDQLATHGSVHAVWAAHKDAGWLLTEVQPQLHYFVHDRGEGQADAQDDVVQIEVWEEQEFVERALFERDGERDLPTANELRSGSPGFVNVAWFERRAIGQPVYRLDSVIDLQRFNALAEATFIANRQRDGNRQIRETNTTTGESRVVSVRELSPGYDDLRWRGRRFFDDWTASSAGRAGERICSRWVFSTSDYTDPKGVRTLDFIPRWTHTAKIAELKNTHRLDAYGLYGKLNQFCERIGHPFAWYFYGLHGNLVRDPHLTRVLEAAEEGLIVLPEHDYQVLKRWHDDPYGF